MSVFVMLSVAVQTGMTQAWDAQVVRACVAHQTRLEHMVLQGISLLGSGWMLLLAVLLSIAALLRRKMRPDALRLLIAIGGGEVLVNALKWLFHRPRPSPVYASLGHAFPSGHSFFSLTVYSLAAIYFSGRWPQHRRAIWLCAGLLVLATGLSRIAVGVHYPTDVAGGFALALPWLWVCRISSKRKVFR